MNFRAVFQFLKSPLGRVFAALIGLALVGLICARVGSEHLMSVIAHSARYFPWIVLLELVILACTVMGLRSLYGEDKFKIPTSAYARAGLIGYAVMGLVPAGRAFAESTRAILLSKYSSGAKAAAAATQLQCAALLANAAISVPCALVMYSVAGFSIATLLIIGNVVGSIFLGGLIWIALSRTDADHPFLARFENFRKFAREYREHFSAQTTFPAEAFGWEFLGRIFQVIQKGVLVLAVGGQFRAFTAFCSESLHVSGSLIGELIPAQLGATESSYMLWGHVLALPAAALLTMPLLSHLAQLFWVAIGLIVPIVWPQTEDAQLLNGA